MTQDAIAFMAIILRQRNSDLSMEQSFLLAEVCVHSSNAVTLAALRSPQEDHRQQLIQQIEDLLVSYLEPHVGDTPPGVALRDRTGGNVREVRECPHCQSSRLFKNGHRRGKQCYRCKDCGKQFVEQSSR